MNHFQGNECMLSQRLLWGKVLQERESPASTMYTTTGRRIYSIGDIDGRFRPRSNPYDLHTFGHPRPDDPLAEKLQGVWAQPVKAVNSYTYTLTADGEDWRLEDAQRFTQAFACVQFEFQRESLYAIRRDFAALDLPLLFSTLAFSNQGTRPLDLRLTFAVVFDLQDAWFTSLAGERNAGETVRVEDGVLLACSQVLPDAWAVLVGGYLPAAADYLPPHSARVTGPHAGELAYELQLAPGEEQRLVFGISVETQAGAQAARSLLMEYLPHSERFFTENQARYAEVFTGGPRLVSPDAKMNLAFALAQANLRILEAEQPGMGRYFYAGLEIFPFWFSNDWAYSLPGLMAAGLRDAALNHVHIGAHHLEAGRVPHQISPSSRVAFPGNAPETPLWVTSIWDAYRWSGDRAFLAQMYPGAREGMFDYVLGKIDPDGDGYPSGPGMVEVEGMGAEKLDSAAYTWAALLALASMAEALGKEEDACRARERAGQIANRFDTDWWNPLAGCYAMSLQDPGNQQFAASHWAVITPLEVGLASPALAAQTFATLRHGYLNRWGLKHTLGDDERVWTLPTAALSRAAFRYGEAGLGLAMLRNIAETLNAGSIGLFHELIPEGACIIQLWSAATFLRGIIEDLLGIQVSAAEHLLELRPQIAEDWSEVMLENLAFGEHHIQVQIGKAQAVITHQSGREPLTARMAGSEVRIPPGEIGTLFLNFQSAEKSY